MIAATYTHDGKKGYGFGKTNAEAWINAINAIVKKVKNENKR